MEIKYTLEILTKDIQDIGKLVENLQNSPEGSTLELDLALSKLRNVYDILTVIRTDITIPGALYKQVPDAAPPPPVATQAVVAPAPEPEILPEPVVEQEPVVEPEPIPEPEPILEIPAPEPEPEPEPIVEIPAPEPIVKPIVEPVVETSKPGKDIIADKFAAESSINENMAGNREQDMEAKLIGKPIDNIGRNIGINDRFLIIRELFDGDSDGFGKLIKDLDNADSLQVAEEKLSGQFENTPTHEGVAILGKLVKRRYS